MNIAKQLFTDVLVIGAGAAGMRAALAAADAGAKVLLTTKGPIAKSGITLTAGGGMEAPVYPGDSPEQYYQDTVQAGYRLADQNLARALAEDACARALDVERYGARFVRTDDGKYATNQFPGQSFPRSLFFKGGGFGLVLGLTKACRSHGNISIFEDFFVTGLLENKSASQTAVTGAIGISLKTGELVQIDAKAVVMATGGCQWLWEINDVPTDSVGDGIIYAYRVGAELVDMEMVQFYPSVIIWPPSPQGAFVHYEYLSATKLDGNIYDKDGKPVLPKPLPMRGEAMRIMASAINEGNGTAHGGLEWYVGDSSKGQDVVRKTLNIAQYNYIRANGIEPTTDRIEVAPGAHYMMGGILIDEKCRTKIKGLFATTECAGNFDGADRLAGNGLAATQVFGARAGLYAYEWAKANPQLAADPASVEAETERIAARLTTGNGAEWQLARLTKRLRAAVQRYAGVSRDKAGLEALLQIAADVQSESAGVKVSQIVAYNQCLVELLQLDIMCEVAKIVAGCALLREESRGHHYRVDFPHRDDANWLKHTKAVRGETGPCFGTQPIVII